MYPNYQIANYVKLLYFYLHFEIIKFKLKKKLKHHIVIKINRISQFEVSLMQSDSATF